MSFFIICENWQVLHTVGYSHFVCDLCSSICVCVILFVCEFDFSFGCCLLLVVCVKKWGRIVLWRMCIVYFFSHAKRGGAFRAEESLQLFSLHFHFPEKEQGCCCCCCIERCPVGSLIVGARWWMIWDEPFWVCFCCGCCYLVWVNVLFCLWMLPRRRGFSTKKKKCVCVCFLFVYFFYYECSSFQIVSTMFLDSYCHQRNREKSFFLFVTVL